MGGAPRGEGGGAGRYSQENELELKLRLKIQSVSRLEPGVAELLRPGCCKMKSKVGIDEGVERVGRQMARNEMPGQERPLSMCWLTAASEKQAGFDRKDRALTVSHVLSSGWKLCRGGYGCAQHGTWGTVAFLPKHKGLSGKPGARVVYKIN